MSRKFKKGYFVRGQFVAEGSELDLQMKAELKGTDAASRTEMKAESDQLQELGEQLMTLRIEQFTRLGLGEKLHDAILEAKRITNFEGKRRQMQYVGKLMRRQDDATLDKIHAALDEQHNGSAHENAALHKSEAWRDRLIADDGSLAEWMAAYPETDSQQLRALVRQVRKDAKPETPGAAPRHGRAYRDVFQLVRQHLMATDGPLNDGIPPTEGEDDE